MKNVDEALKALVNEYTALPSASANPLLLANFCNDLEKGVMAVDSISRGIGDGNADPRGQAAALEIVTTQLMFNVRAMHLMLLSMAGHR